MVGLGSTSCFNKKEQSSKCIFATIDYNIPYCIDYHSIKTVKRHTSESLVDGTSMYNMYEVCI